MLDRAWVRRGLVGPAKWGRTLSSAWLDSEVTFLRVERVDDGYGGFSSSDGPVEFLTCQAHVRFVSDGASTGPFTVPAEGGTSTNRRRLDIRFEYPPDPDLYPKRGDSVEFVLDTGVKLRLYVDNVHSPRNWRDHLKVETEWFE